jgi:hypothetical protein
MPVLKAAEEIKNVVPHNYWKIIKLIIFSVVTEPNVKKYSSLLYML